jgi:hypothetical protein
MAETSEGKESNTKLETEAIVNKRWGILIRKKISKGLQEDTKAPFFFFFLQRLSGVSK